jgi:hypothetical protein
MLVFLGIVAAIAERFVRGFAAATESCTVAYAIGLSVGRLHLDAATNPERATDAYLGVFYGDEGLLQDWLDGQSQDSSIMICLIFGSSQSLMRFQMPPARWQKRADAQSSS